MDLEANRMLLPQERCQACILRRRQKATRRTVRSIAFIAYNVFLFSVVFYTFWYFNDRLARNEKNVADLLQQRSATEEHTSLGISPFLDSTQAKELQVQEENAEFSNIIESTRRKREAKSKMKRRGKGKRGKKCKNCLPVVQVEGKGGYGYKDKSNLTNLWAISKWVNPTNKQISKYYDVSSVPKSGQIKVKESGLYMLYAQMNLIGPSVKGYDIFMKDGPNSPEFIASCKRNYNLDQTETCFTMKMALTGVTKRGFHVKRNPSKTTIASCANHSRVEGTEESAKTIIRPCTLFTVLRFNKDDVVYIEEMENNSNVLYTRLTAVFGLIKIGV